MACIGLSGTGLIPLLLGLGCNVPAVLSTRMLNQGRERALSMIMIPFVPCSARLAVFSVFASLFFPEHTVAVVASLYLIGVFLAGFSALVFGPSLPGSRAEKLLELPPYLRPSWQLLVGHSLQRVGEFVWRAAPILVPFTAFLAWLQHSGVWLETLGRWLQVVVAPMGITPENWPATIGLVVGAVAKEGVLASLDALYGNHSSLVAHFGGSAAAYSYVLFVLLYIPCLSTMVAIAREQTVRLALWITAWNLGLAYSISVMSYQFATFGSHPGASLQALLLASLGVWALLVLVKKNLASIPLENSCSACRSCVGC